MEGMSKNAHGGRRAGAGRPRGRKVTKVSLDIDNELIGIWRSMKNKRALVHDALRAYAEAHRVTIEQQADGLYRATHAAGVSVIFPRGHFKDQQRVETTAGAFAGKSPTEIASVLTEIADYVAAERYDEAMNE